MGSCWNLGSHVIRQSRHTHTNKLSLARTQNLTDTGLYKLGRGPVVAHLDIVVENRQSPVWNVLGTIRGSVEPDRHVILGNHRDAWVYGAVDPNSGTAALLEIARALGQMLRAGWRPRRSIVLASWDAEEHCLGGWMGGFVCECRWMWLSNAGLSLD